MNGLSAKKRVRGLILVVGAAGAFAVLSFGFAAFAAGEMDSKAKALAKVDDDWSKAAATKDADRVASFYAEDAITYPPNEPAAIGRPAVKKVWAAYFADPSFSISWKTDHAGVAKSGDLGFTAGTYEDSFKGPDGKMVHEKGKYVCTWRKEKDGTCSLSATRKCPVILRWSSPSGPVAPTSHRPTNARHPASLRIFSHSFRLARSSSTCVTFFSGSTSG
jgi:ketosteroid isomerase-like protein